MGKKYYSLYKKDNNAPVAVSNDKWLLELFTVQRGLDASKVYIEKESAEKHFGSGLFIVYYFGHAVTEYEFRYIMAKTSEHVSDINYQIYELERILNIHKGKLKSKDKKRIKKTIHVLKKINPEEDDTFIASLLDDVIRHKVVVDEYMYAMDRFRECMEGD